MAHRQDDLYFIGAEGLDFVKVGRSKNPSRRLAGLRTGSPYKLRLLHVYPGQGDLEPFVLALLRERVDLNGEWFLHAGTQFDALVGEAEAAHSQRFAAASLARDALLTPADLSFTLGEAIRKARIDEGMTQQDLAVATGISQTYLSQVEHDKRDPKWSLVKRLQAALPPLSLDAAAWAEAFIK